MKKLLKLFIYIFVMVALIIVFLPKVNAYYAAEKMMKDKQVYITDEKVVDNGLSLELIDAKVYFDKLELMKVENIKLSPWILYNTLELNYIDINEGFSDFLPQDINSVKVEHFFYNPLYIKLSGDSSDSFFNGEVDILNRMIRVHLNVGVKSEKKYKNLLKKLRKEPEEEGGYYYEYKF